MSDAVELEWTVPQMTDQYGDDVPVTGGTLDGQTAPARGPVLYFALESTEETYRLQRDEAGELRFVFARSRPRVI